MLSVQSGIHRCCHCDDLVSELCDLTIKIPITGAASSLNAATAATAVLYEISRQRILTRRHRTDPGAAR